MAARYDSIEHLLKSARASLRRTDILAGILACLTAVAGVLLLSFGLALFDAPARTIRTPFLVLSAIAFLATLGWFLLRPILRRIPDDWVAFKLGEKHDGIGDKLVSAVQLERDEVKMSEKYGVSRALIDRHVHKVAEEAADVDPRSLANKRGLSLHARAALFSIGGYAILALLLPSIAERGRALFAGVPDPVGADIVANPAKKTGAAPQFGDFTITYHYPEYTGRDSETVPGASGNLQAIKGTVADISLATDKPVTNAEMVINDKDKLPLTVSADGRTLNGQITLVEDGSYVIAAVGKAGREATDDNPKTITVEPDRVPSVEILYPPSVQVVNEMQELPVAWTANDDFGLRKATLVYEQSGKKKRVVLWTPQKEPPKSTGATYRWSLAGLKLEPKKPVNYWVEVLDTDTVSGPKKGRSATHQLKVLSSEEIHAQVIAMQEELLRVMIGVLGDHLVDKTQPHTAGSDEEIVEAAERLGGRVDLLTTSLEKVLRKMLDDPLGDEGVYLALDEMKRDLKQTSSDYESQVVNLRMAFRMADLPEAHRIRRRGAALVSVRGGAIIELEQDVLFLEDLIMKQRLDAAAQELARLMEEQADLRALLDKYKRGEADDKEMAKALEAKLAELQQRMAEIAQKLASNMPQIADSFQNQQAQGQDLMEQIRKAIEEGRMDDAAALTEQLLAALDQTMQGFEQQRQRMTMDPETMAKLQEASKELESIQKRQNEIVQQTKQLRDDIRKQMDQKSKEQIPKFVDKMQKEVEKLREQIDDMNKAAADDPWMRGITRGSRRMLDQSVGRLEETLKAHELGESLEHARDTEQTLEGLADTAEQIQSNPRTAQKTAQKARKAEQTAKDIKKDLEKLRRQFEDAASKGQREAMQQLQGEQKQLQQQAQKLGQQMQGMGQQTPFLPGRTGQKLQQAAGSMGQAQQRLGQGNAASALPSERQASRQLAEAQNDMKNAMKGSRPGQQQGKPLGQRMGMGQDTPWSRGGDISHRPIEIPDPSQYKAPKEFREDIIKAMKKPSPEGYEDMNEDYYERLVK